MSALAPDDASRMETVPTCGDGDTCATVRLERLPQGKPGGCSRGPAGARLAPGRCVSQSCMTKEPDGAYGHTCHTGWVAAIHARRALFARANLCWDLSCRWRPRQGAVDLWAFS